MCIIRGSFALYCRELQGGEKSELPDARVDLSFEQRIISNGAGR